MPILLAPSVAPDAMSAQGVGALVRLTGLKIGRILLGDQRTDTNPWPLDPTEIKAIITNWDMVERVLAQIEPSLSDDTYIWSSGDHHDELTINGIAIQQDCRSRDQGQSQERHGFSYVLDFYRANRLSVRETPLAIQLGDVTIRSRLLALRLAGQVNTNLVPFSLTFIGAPPPRARKLR